MNLNISSFLIMSMALTTFLVMTIMLSSQSQIYILEKKSQFECGFNEMSKNKSSFSTKFFLVMILFLVFDLEIAVLLPSCSIQEHSKISMIPPMIFIILLTMAMLIEWYNGMIEWSS